jgi:hypothetical protein
LTARAEKNTDDLLEELNGNFHRLRQSSIDEELFDVIAGYEALPQEAGLGAPAAADGHRPSKPPLRGRPPASPCNRHLGAAAFGRVGGFCAAHSIMINFKEFTLLRRGKHGSSF